MGTGTSKTRSQSPFFQALNGEPCLSPFPQEPSFPHAVAIGQAKLLQSGVGDMPNSCLGGVGKHNSISIFGIDSPAGNKTVTHEIHERLPEFDAYQHKWKVLHLMSLD